MELMAIGLEAIRWGALGVWAIAKQHGCLQHQEPSEHELPGTLASVANVKIYFWTRIALLFEIILVADLVFGGLVAPGELLPFIGPLAVLTIFSAIGAGLLLPTAVVLDCIGAFIHLCAIAVRVQSHTTRSRALWTVSKAAHPVLLAFVSLFIFVDSKKAICCQVLRPVCYILGLWMDCRTVQSPHREADELQLCSNFTHEVSSELLASVLVFATIRAFEKVTDLMISSFDQCLRATTLLGALCDFQITLSKELLIGTGTRALGHLLNREIVVGSNFLDFLPRAQQDIFNSFFQAQFQAQLQQQMPYPINIELIGQAGHAVPVAVLMAVSHVSKHATLAISSAAEVQSQLPPDPEVEAHRSRTEAEAEIFCLKAHHSPTEAETEMFCLIEPEEDVCSEGETLRTGNPEECNKKQAAEVATLMAALAADDTQASQWDVERSRRTSPDFSGEFSLPPKARFVPPATDPHAADDGNNTVITEFALSQ